jgi:large subunit ribosomal protein L10
MRAEKQYLLDEMIEGIDNSEMMMVLSYQKLDANNTAEFRKEVGKSGGSMLVVKKRVFLKAAESAGYVLNHKDMKGHIGLVFSATEAVTTTKAIYKFRKDKDQTLEILGGHFQKKICTSSDFEKISKLPSLDQMRSQFLGLLEAPMAETLSVMDALLTSVMHCLENKANQSS